MKKQILILILAIIAIGFSSSVFGQVTNPDHNVAPVCDGSAATPSVGEEYTYQVDIPAGLYSETDGTFDWYIMTQGQVDLMGGTHIANGTAVTDQFIASGFYDTPTAGANAIDITWNSSALATGLPYYLVVVYTDPTATCATNNMKVYRVEPRNTFWLAMVTEGTSFCPGVLSGATLNAAGTEVEYLFGQQTLTTVISATGYTGEWSARLNLNGFAADQTILVSWAGETSGTGTFTAPATLNGIYTANGLPSTFDGEDITITIVVNNNHFENLTGQTIDIGVDGTFILGATTYHDMWAGPDGDACLVDDGFGDTVQHTITARPQINPNNPGTFVIQTAP